MPQVRVLVFILRYEMISTPQLVRISSGSQAWFCLTHLVLLTHPGRTKSKRTQPLLPTKFPTLLHSREFSLMEVELLQRGRQSLCISALASPPVSLLSQAHGIHKRNSLLFTSQKAPVFCSAPCHLPPLLHGVGACPASLVCGPATHQSPFLLRESTST